MANERRSSSSVSDVQRRVTSRCTRLGSSPPGMRSTNGRVKTRPAWHTSAAGQPEAARRDVDAQPRATPQLATVGTSRRSSSPTAQRRTPIGSRSPSRPAAGIAGATHGHAPHTANCDVYWFCHNTRIAGSMLTHVRLTSGRPPDTRPAARRGKGGTLHSDVRRVVANRPGDPTLLGYVAGQEESHARRSFTGPRRRCRVARSSE